MRLGTPIEIAYWIGSRRQLPTVEEIMARWEVHRATAYRWLAFAKSGGRSQQAGRLNRPGKH